MEKALTLASSTEKLLASAEENLTTLKNMEVRKKIAPLLLRARSIRRGISMWKADFLKLLIELSVAFEGEMQLPTMNIRIFLGETLSLEASCGLIRNTFPEEVSKILDYAHEEYFKLCQCIIHELTNAPIEQRRLTREIREIRNLAHQLNQLVEVQG